MCVYVYIYIYLYTAFDYICLRDTCGPNVSNSLQTSVSPVRVHKEVSMRDGDEQLYRPAPVKSSRR